MTLHTGETLLENDDDIIRDGEVRRVSMYAMDGLDNIQRAIANVSASVPAMHAPGPLAFDDADREQSIKLYQDYETRLTTGWKDPLPTPVIADVALTIPAHVMPSMQSEDRAAPYAAYNARIERQWENPLP